MQNTTNKAPEDSNKIINNKDPIQIKEDKKEVTSESNNTNNNKNINKELLKKSEKLNKSIELLDFDVVSHFNENLSRPDLNDLNNITPNSYYCINCKHSECPFYAEKKHIFISRPKCLLYDTHFFDQMKSYVNEGLNFCELKNELKNNINNFMEKIKESLDKLRDNKFNEIDIFFEENEKNIKKIKEEYLITKKNIEEYYEINKKFFNIELINDNNTNLNNNINTEEKILSENENSTLLLDNSNNNIINNYIDDLDNSSPNRDIENDIFLLNFELMNLCETKNLEHINSIKNIKKRIELFNINIQEELLLDIDICSKFLKLDFKPEIFLENNYWDVNLRTKKYSEIIKQFRETICDIYHRTGNLEKIKDLIDILDSKQKKNNQIIFGQNYFNNNENNKIDINTINNNNKENINNNNITLRNTVNSRKKNVSASHRKPLSKPKSLKKYNTQRGKSNSKIKKKENRNNLTNIKSINPLTLSNDILLRNIIKNKNERYIKTETHDNNNSLNINRKATNNNQKIISFENCVPDDIILDKRVIQRFLAYSISELYKKNFAKIDNNKDDINDIYFKILNKDNIYLNKERKSTNQINISVNNNSKNKFKNRGLSAKKNIKSNNIINNNNKLIQDYYNKIKQKNNDNNIKVNNIDKDKIDIEKIDLDKRYNVKSVSYLSNYTNRYNSLKEIAKPIIGTNQIQLFFPQNQKIIRKNTTLNKDEHGYNLFPEGCRHILVENNLYIIGGTNHVRQPINIVLVYHILFGTLKRLPDMIFSHSYHTVDYLENFDSIICIGGENSNQCEIMNLENKKWFKLPNLNNQRANANIYYNNLNSEIFVLFGICGIMCDKIYYSDSIEVLELKDIAKGWIIIDYYKTPGLNLKVNYCMTIPFTKEQLLIYGGSNMRSFTKNIYALFHMTKNECNKVDAQTMELIKLEEKKSRLVDLALTKLG